MVKDHLKKFTTPYFLFGSLSILLIVVVLIVEKYLSPDQRFFFKILFALGCAGLSATIPGITSLKYKGLISAGGAGVIFLLILKINPPESQFSITVFPKENSTGNIVDLENSILELQLNSGFLKGDFTSNKTLKFNDIPNAYFGETLNIYLNNNEKWVFVNGKKNMGIKLEKENMDIYLMKDSNYLRISGTFYLNKKPLSGALVKDLQNEINKVYTNSDGHFELIFGRDDTREKITLTIERSGLDIPPFQIPMGTKNIERNFSQ